MVPPGELAVVARLWAQARSVGSAVAPLHLPPGTREPGLLYCIDLRPTHGVAVVLFASGEAGEDVVPVGHATTASSTRFARCWKDANAVYLDVDSGFEQLLGWTRAELLGNRSVDLVHPDDRDVGVDSWIRMSEMPGPARPIRIRLRHKAGHWVWVEIVNHNRLGDSDHGDVLAEMLDVSDEVATQESLQARHQLLEQLTESVPLGLFHADRDGQVLYANGRLTEITGIVAGRLVRDWLGVGGPRVSAVVDDLMAHARAGRPGESTVEVVGVTGDAVYCSVSLRPLADPSGTVIGVTGAVEDVTGAVIERRDLEMRAATDSLTGCLNRSAAMAAIQRALDAVPGNSTKPDGVAVMFVDVDNLKEVNDRLGHSAGDALLAEVGERLRSSVRAHDDVGRFGGDEFVLVATHMSGGSQAMSVARWITSRVRQQFAVEGRRLDIRISLGVAWTDSVGSQAEWLVRQADAAMYVSKRQGQCEPVLASTGD
jgi:diguanylate cyclase (GGDEF)-like protein/PAS domain S-box-containing protein